jgi:hypothetical protein
MSRHVIKNSRDVGEFLEIFNWLGRVYFKASN